MRIDGLYGLTPDLGFDSLAPPIDFSLLNLDGEVAQRPRQSAGQDTDTQMFVQGTRDATSIHWNDIRQSHMAATCTILAAAGGLAYTEHGRRALTRIVRDEGNGNVGVTLWAKETLELTGMSEMSIPLAKVKGMPVGAGDQTGSAGDPRWEIWPKALEAGFARGAKQLFDIEFHRNPVRPEGAPIELALQAVTGEPVTTKTMGSMANLSDQQVLSLIGKELNRDKLILAGSIEDPSITGAGLVPRHAYAVLGVNTQSNTVFLFDPHGKTLSVSTDTFRASFDRVAWGYVP